MKSLKLEKRIWMVSIHKTTLHKTGNQAFTYQSKARRFTKRLIGHHSLS